MGQAVSPARLDGRRVVVFSDFDGTITEHDVIEMIMEAFAPPVWRDIASQILDARTLSIREGVGQLFHLLPSDRKDAIAHHVKTEVTLRQGFERFLDTCDAHGIPFDLVSGGVDFFIEPVMAPFAGRLGIFCNKALFQDGRIDLEFPFLDEDCASCAQCACCKIAVMDRFPRDTHYRIMIGDSLTDLAAAREADWVFARARLIGYCDEDGIAYTPYETFDDIRAHLLNRLEVPVHAG